MAHLLIHRGIVNKQYKENLLKSFKQSFKKGYGIETDIHATKDNEFICFHDFTLNRIFKKKVSVKNIKYSQDTTETLTSDTSTLEKCFDTIR